MKTWSKVILIFLALGAAGAGGYWFARQNGNGTSTDAATTEPADEAPIVSVQTVPIRRGKVSETATAYGVVQSEPGVTGIVSVPYESQVKRVLVTPGQTVAAGAALVETQTSPDAELQLHQAENELAAASKQVQQVQQKLNSQLATNTDMAQAQQALNNATTQLDSLKRRGVGEAKTLAATIAGVVERIDVQPGQIVAAGAAMVEVSPQDRIEVKLGVEPEDANLLTDRQTVSLRDVHAADASAIAGTVRLIAQRVNPDTRLRDVFVSLPPGTPLVLDTFVSATFVVRTADGLIAPRSAVRPVEEKSILFTAEDGKAARHEVSLGLEDDQNVIVTGDGIAEGSAAIVVGGTELEDGTQVRIEPAAAAPSSAPATAPATEAP